MKKVLVIGSGAREHALAQAFLRSKQVERVIVSPGNDGMTDDGIQIESVPVTDLERLRDLALTQAVDLTFVGNEEPLTLGIVDVFQKVGLSIFGPSRAAAQLEGSKSFTKNILEKYNIPTAQSVTVTSLSAASKAVDTLGLPVVFKLDGLALGKGVTIVNDKTQVSDYLSELYTRDSHAKLVVESYLDGVEFSIFSLVGHNGVVTHAPIAQDHKRRFDHDKGPNTGGMGAYSPVRWISDETQDRAISELVMPTIKAMSEEGTPFTGVLYTGVMLTKDGPKVIEFNVRFGDPEAQVVLPQYMGDFYELIDKLHQGKDVTPSWQKDDVYVGVVLAAEGYPESPITGALVPKVEDVAPLLINYAGVKNGMASGGRVATVVAHGQDATTAQQKVYDKIKQLITDLQYRQDIAYQAVQHENK
ncbi:phosphoribosylamine--glycine ligase [Leuconostoc palmae]|uniref:phosphoribosylamine--glycine ligase n=1 Tax=Leuconostoc palmae TaxID=501487 RepID=UPI001C7D7E91|nr:phosphoribosylamine--glycine ligase [Leuconostoc palmae]